MLKIYRIYQNFLILSAFLIYLTSANASTFLETNNIEDILSHINEHTLLVFDLDNTLIEPKQTLGSEQWFMNYLKQQENLGVEKKAALKKTIVHYNAIQNASDVQLVDSKTIQVFNKTKHREVSTLGLTSRGAHLKEATLRQLESVGISFKILAKSGVQATEHTPYPLKKTKHGIAHSGIIWTAGSHKGECLVEYLDHLQWKPTHVVFIDDKKDHLYNVENALQKRQIPFIGIRYGYLDAKVKAFNPQISAIQLEYFNKILSDEDAQAIADYRVKSTTKAQTDPLLLVSTP